jgi:hypothetical protein
LFVDNARQALRTKAVTARNYLDLGQTFTPAALDLADSRAGHQATAEAFATIRTTLLIWTHKA